MHYPNRFIYTVLIILISFGVKAQILDSSWNALVTSEDSQWFGTNDAIAVADNVLLFQKNIGGWPKNFQPQRFTLEDKKKFELEKDDPIGATIDNGATTQEMIYLSKVFQQTNEEKYRTGFLKGLDYLLKAQYESGGWPQFYPLRKGYYTHITYNDDAMYNVMRLLQDIYDSEVYNHLRIPKGSQDAAKMAFTKGIDCILKTQYIQDGKLTVWCAQHDEHTFLPAKARAYELPSLSGKESVKIVQLLMSIKNPDSAVVKAVTAAKEWFEKSMIKGLQIERSYNEKGKVSSKKVFYDSLAGPLWGRFMELEDNRAFFSDRDGIKKYNLSEIGSERRNGYRWYTDEPLKILRDYPKWKASLEDKKKKLKKVNIYNLVVAKDGSGDFETLQDAIDAAKGFPDKPVTIKVKNGVYNEKVEVYEWNTHMSIIGEDRQKTIITFDDYFDKLNLGRNSTFHTPTFLIQGNDFFAKNLTIKNTAGDVGQAVALAINANRVKIENCTITGNQDTVYVTGEGFKQYFKDCYIEGTTDFIFGQATTLFENCEIHSKSNSFITAASTPAGMEYGYVFKNCQLTAEENLNKVYLGRPWRTYAKTVFIGCEIGSHISPEGWDNWNNKKAEKKSFYAEYNNTGPGSSTSKRVIWSHQLTKKQARKYSIKNILGDILWYTKH